MILSGAVVELTNNVPVPLTPPATVPEIVPSVATEPVPGVDPVSGTTAYGSSADVMMADRGLTRAIGDSDNGVVKLP